MINWNMTHIERHRAMHEAQMKIHEQAQLLIVSVCAVGMAFLLGLYCGAAL